MSRAPLPTSPFPVTAYVGLGANLGDRQANLRQALSLIGQTDGVQVVRASSFFENPAVGGPADSPPFLNAVAELAVGMRPQPLLDRLLAIEAQLGRVRTVKWGPRIIDLDLLLYGPEIIHAPGLVVPHPLMHERRFVLQPLAEIAPAAWHPALRKTAAELLAAL